MIHRKNITLINALNKISKTKIISEDKEIKILRSLREKIWKTKYGSSVLRKTFGTLKFKKSTDQILKESDKELYND